MKKERPTREARVLTLLARISVASLWNLKRMCLRTNAAQSVKRTCSPTIWTWPTSLRPACRYARTTGLWVLYQSLLQGSVLQFLTRLNVHWIVHDQINTRTGRVGEFSVAQKMAS